MAWAMVLHAALQDASRTDPHAPRTPQLLECVRYFGALNLGTEHYRVKRADQPPYQVRPLIPAQTKRGTLKVPLCSKRFLERGLGLHDRLFFAVSYLFLTVGHSGFAGETNAALFIDS